MSLLDFRWASEAGWGCGRMTAAFSSGRNLCEDQQCPSWEHILVLLPFIPQPTLLRFFFSKQCARLAWPGRTVLSVTGHYRGTGGLESIFVTRGNQSRDNSGLRHPCLSFSWLNKKVIQHLKYFYCIWSGEWCFQGFINKQSATNTAVL